MEAKPHRSSAAELLRSRFVSGVFVALIARLRSDEGSSPAGKAGIESGLVGLSRLFYYAEGPGREARLEEELAFAELYLRLQALRYEGRLDYRVSTEPGLELRRVPRLATLAGLELASARLLELSANSAFISVTARRGAFGRVELGVEGEPREAAAIGGLPLPPPDSSS